MKKFIDFLTYNNAVPIALGILFLGAGGALAASPAAQSAVYDAKTGVQSIDNTRIIAVDLDQYPFTLTVVNITEDDESYYVDYTLASVELQDGAWQDVLKQKTLTVTKALLGGRDLGVYATQQLAEVREYERSRLKETQVIEQKLGPSQKMVATVYSGLIGAMLDPTTETFPTYDPVIDAPLLTVFSPVEGAPLTAAGSGPAPTTSGSPSTGSGSSSDREPPAVTLVGASPARIALNSTYIDEGVIATDNSGEPTIVLKVDGQEVSEVSLDTSKVWAYIITYIARDSAGNESTITREVVIDGEASTLPPPPAEEESGDNEEGEWQGTTTPEI